MAKVELKIDTTEAMKKIEELKIEMEKFKAAMIEAQYTAEDLAKAMQDFVEAFNKLGDVE